MIDTHSLPRWRSILLLAAGAAFAAGIFAARRPSGSAPPAQTFGRERVTAIAAAGSVSLRLSDMDDGLALRVADSTGQAIPIAQMHASAVLLREGEGITVMPFSEMNGDHLMMHARNDRPARLVVEATINGRNYTAPFDLPLSPDSRPAAEREESHGIH